MPVDNNATIVDLDDVLRQWAQEAMGANFTIDTIDTSQVVVEQQSLVLAQDRRSVHSDFRRSGEWVLDNTNKHQMTCEYSAVTCFDSEVHWRIVKGPKSKFLPQVELLLRVPNTSVLKSVQLYSDGKQYIHGKPLATKVHMEWLLQSQFFIRPLSSVCASSEINVCHLKDVPFTSDILISGFVTATAHKKRKFWIKRKAVAGVDIALGRSDHVRISNASKISTLKSKQTLPVESKDQPSVIFTVQGLCSGNVPIDARVNIAPLH